MDHGRDEHVLAEQVFVLRCVGFWSLRGVVVERTHEGDAGVKGAACLRIYVRLHGIPKLEASAHDIAIGFWIGPDATFAFSVLACVRAQNRAEGAELDPAHIELWLDDAGHVSADVVRPIGVADVGSRCGEPWLEGQGIPGGDRVSRKADLVTVIAEAAPAMKEKRAFALVLLVGEVDVIEPPGRIDAGSLRIVLLLPVKPPE